MYCVFRLNLLIKSVVEIKISLEIKMTAKISYFITYTPIYTIQTLKSLEKIP